MMLIHTVLCAHFIVYMLDMYIFGAPLHHIPESN